MRLPTSYHFPPARQRKAARSRQMRERRTALALAIFGAALASIELYVVLAAH